MILFGLLYKKSHRSIMNVIEVSWNCHRSIIKPSQNRHKASCIISKPPTCEKCPKIVRYFGHSMPTIWVMSARYLFSQCPTLGPWVPTWRAGTDRLMVSNRSPYVLLFLILLVNLFSYSYFVFTFFISWKNRHFQFYKTEIVDTSFLAF